MLKLAVIIGDYSNGWSDCIMVQLHSDKIQQNDCMKDRESTMNILNKHAIEALSELENNDKINPKPNDEPCCEKFEEWAKETDIKVGKDMAVCPMCLTKISDERKKKYFKNAKVF